MKEIKLTKGYSAIVDDEDYPAISQYSWYAEETKGHVYARRRVTISRGKTKLLSMHRAIINPLDNQDVDHIDNNGLNNTKANLRACSRAENIRNQVKHKGSIPKYKGVSYDSSRKKWTAAICVNRRQMSLGRFNTELEAAEARDKAAKELHGEYAHINFPK